MPSNSPRVPLTLTVVTAPGCHFCEDAQDAICLLAAEGFRVQLDSVDAQSDQGLRLISQHRPAMNPLVLVDGQYFSAGRLPQRKLRSLLTKLGAHPGIGVSHG